MKLSAVCMVGVVACGLVASAFLGGCTSYSSPELSLNRAEATERTDDGVAMRFVIDAKNDNTDTLPLRSVEYRLEMDGQQVFTGTRSAEATLRRKGVQQVVLPAVMSTQSAGGGGGKAQPASGPRRFRLSGTMYYITPGQLAEVLFDAGVRTPSVSFGFDGEIDLSQAAYVPQATPVQVPEPLKRPEVPPKAPSEDEPAKPDTGK